MIITAAVLCMATNLYHEARGDGLASQIAVAQSVINRVKDPRYPNTVCEVVHQAQYYTKEKKVPKRNKCQYSWYCDGKSDVPQNTKVMDEMIQLAQTLLKDPHLDITEGSTHYHATFVTPYWASKMEYVTTIGSHKFYRTKNKEKTK